MELVQDTYRAFADDDLLGEVVMERMPAGLTTRRHRASNEPVGAAVETGAAPGTSAARGRPPAPGRAGRVDQRPALAFTHADPGAGRRRACDLARQLEAP
jgi:hypothetical protein